MAYEIIDFHTHPFTDADSNICSYKKDGMEDTAAYLKGLGITKICGSVICRSGDGHWWEAILESNRRALALREKYGDFYVPGFHVHPDYVKESCEEIEKNAQPGGSAHRRAGALYARLERLLLQGF